MRTTRTIAGVALAGLALLGAGCGDDDGGSSTTTAAATTPAATTAAPATTASALATTERVEPTTAAVESAAGDAATTDATEMPSLGAENPLSTESTIAEPTKAAFVAEADAICRTYEDAIDALGEPQTAADLPIFLERAVALQEEQITELQALQPPPGDEAFWTEILGLLGQIRDVAKELQSAAASGADEQQLGGILERGEVISDQADEKSDGYGFVVCGD